MDNASWRSPAATVHLTEVHANLAGFPLKALTQGLLSTAVTPMLEVI